MAQIQSLNHSAICVHDLQDAEDFYCDVLGARAVSTTDFVTEDVIKGRSLHKSIILEDYLIALMLARDFMPMPEDAQNRGAHGFRHAFYVPQARFDELLETLGAHNIQFDGPVVHSEKGPFGASIYLKDPSGNFLEFLWRRDEDAKYDVVDGVGEG